MIDKGDVFSPSEAELISEANNLEAQGPGLGINADRARRNGPPGIGDKLRFEETHGNPSLPNNPVKSEAK